MESNSKLRWRSENDMYQLLKSIRVIVQRRYFVASVNTEHKYVPELGNLHND